MKYNKNVLKKWLDRYGIYILSFSCLILLLIVIVPNFSDSRDNKDYVVRSSNAISRQPVEEEDTSDIFRKNESKAINTLVNSYYGSLMGKEGMLLTRYVDDISKIPDISKKLYANHIQLLEIGDIYVADGLVENTYLVVVNGYETVKGTDSRVPFLDKFYVASNVEGSLYIALKEQSESVSVYNELVFENEFVTKLETKVAKEFDEMLEKDEKLQKIFAGLGGN